MKRLMILTAGLFAVHEVNAQITLAPELGVYNSDMVYKSNSGNTINKESKYMPRVGAVLNFHVYRNFSIETGLFYKQTGVKANQLISYYAGSSGFDSDLKLNNFELPVSLRYDYKLGKAGSLFGAAGPYMGYAFKGTSKGVTYINGVASDNNYDVTLGSGTAYNMKRIDLGFNFGLGYQSPIGLYLRAQYGLGLTDLSNQSTKTMRNRGASLAVGYAFKLK